MTGWSEKGWLSAAAQLQVASWWPYGEADTLFAKAKVDWVKVEALYDQH